MTSQELQERYEEIKDMYLNQNISSTQIAKILGAKRHQINYILEKNNISKTFSEARREYYLNEHYFDEIDTPNKAYILGFLYADGYNNDINHTIVLSLQEKDKDTLEKIRNEIGCEKPLYHIHSINKYDNKPREMESLVLASKHMSETIKKWGLVPNKTFIIEFPAFLSDELIPHFIRGYFDGDGCAYVEHRNNRRDRLFISIMSSTIFCNNMQKYLEEKENIKMYVNHPTGKKEENSIIRATKYDTVKKLSNYIYKNADLYMDRKYKIIQEFFMIQKN